MGKIYWCAQDCSNYSGKNVQDRTVTLHRFPANKINRKIWIQRVKNHRKNFAWSEIKLKTARLCSEHFNGLKGPSKETPIPSICPQKIYASCLVGDDTLCTPQIRVECIGDESANSGGSDSEMDCTMVLQIDHPLNTSLHMHDYTGPVQKSSIRLCDKYIQTEPVTVEVNEDKESDSKNTFHSDVPICSCKCHVESESPVLTQSDTHSTCEIAIQTELPDLTVEDLKDNDDEVMFYTGFPTFLSFMMIFNILKQRASCMSYWKGKKSNREETYQRNDKKKPGPDRKMRLIDEFLLVFMRLRLGLFEEDLAKRFKISISTCCSIWRTWVRFLSDNMAPQLMFWPSKEAVQSQMPECFKVRYPDTRVILDCTEIKTETPESTKAKTLLYSNYKSHMTWKILVGITPAGVPSFVSDCYNGNVSDKKITELSGVLDLCEAGDAVMVDKGFLISDICTQKKIKIIIPHFKKKKKFSKREVEETRRIANLRIHIEREMQRIKIFKNLNGVIPISAHDTVSDVFKICTSMTVLYPNLVQN